MDVCGNEWINQVWPQFTALGDSVLFILPFESVHHLEYERYFMKWDIYIMWRSKLFMGEASRSPLVAAEKAAVIAWLGPVCHPLAL